MIKIRRVKIGDEHILAYIQNESWKEAFKDIIPKENLPKYVNYDRSVEMYRKNLSINLGNGYILEVDSKPCLLAYWNKTREDNMEEYAELICIHSLPSYWHKGYGTIMMKQILEDIQKCGYMKVMLWVFDNNYRAISFYKKLGFIASGIKKAGFDAVEEMYVLNL